MKNDGLESYTKDNYEKVMNNNIFMETKSHYVKKKITSHIREQKKKTHHKQANTKSKTTRKNNRTMKRGLQTGK